MDEMMEILKNLTGAIIYINKNRNQLRYFLFSGIYAARKGCEDNLGKKAIIDGILTLQWYFR